MWIKIKKNIYTQIERRRNLYSELNLGNFVHIRGLFSCQNLFEKKEEEEKLYLIFGFMNLCQLFHSPV